MNDRKTTRRNAIFAAVSQKLSALFSHSQEAELMSTDPDPVPIREFSEEPPTDERQRQLQDSLRNYVIEHLADTDLSVVTMAKGLNCSRTMLFNMMHDAFGISPGSYISEKRMQYAAELLRMGVKPTIVSQRCGYADPKYFGKVFKKRFGVIPSKAYVASDQDDR